MTRTGPLLAALVLLLTPCPAFAHKARHRHRHRSPHAHRLAHAHRPPRPFAFQPRSLDGSRNNRFHPSWGRAGSAYSRLAPPSYPDDTGAQADGPSPRFISNRVFNDVGQNVFSERGVSQWAWTWAQFMDHTFGLAASGTERAPIAFDPDDPLEAFRNDLGAIPFVRDAAAGTGGPRQQVNTVSSYIDAWSVYGGTPQRLEWLREGPVDGDLRNNGPHLLAPGGYLPRASARGDASGAPVMALDGRLRMQPADAAEAGDVRANENMALTAVHTLFVREHNRIVDALPLRLSAERKFQIARRVVGAEQQFVTYQEFLPALGVRLRRYGGYRPNVDASLSNEFATVGYRAHSMIHGEFEIAADTAAYPAGERARLEALGVEVSPGELDVPLNAAFFEPDLVPAIGLGPILAGLSDEPQYKNDEQIDNSLRSVLFQFPGPAAPDPAACFSDPTAEGCFQAVVDLGAIDVQRGRDHGMPSYNQLRRAVGLPPRRSFTAITGESTDSFPADPEIDADDPIDDPSILDVLKLFDANGDPIADGSEEAEEGARSELRRTTLAARLKAIYGSVDAVDAFVGMVAEPHVPGTEFGPLQLALWRRQFENLRDGDRFFYANDPVLGQIARRYGITYRHSLGELIALNTDVPRAALPRDVFFAAD